MTCPDPDALSDFVDGRVDEAGRVVVEDHLDECDDCRATIAILARARTAEGSHGTGSAAVARSALAEQGAPAAFTPRPAAATPQPTGLERTAGSDAALAETVADAGAPGVELRAGDRVARYVIEDIIGRGGMGIVYGAEDPDLGRGIALKVLRPDFAQQQPDAARRIVREAQAMAQISHANVVPVFDVGTVGDQVFIAMERVRGVSLRGWLHGGARSIGETVDVLIAAGRGLSAAHDAGIVHRDFKPDNVLIGDDGRVRVTDFGLAVDRDGDGAAPMQVVGTPAYMAPEQHAAANVDPRTDQFGFCVALYEAVYGARPFAGKTRGELAESVRRGRVEPAPARTSVPRSLREILLRGLATRPGDRFPTMEALLRALGRDRGKQPRRIAAIAAVLLLAVIVALSADWIARTRAATVTRISFAAARSQLGRLVELRTESFARLSDLVDNRDVFSQVVGHHDQADFGLGTEDEDRANLEHLHDNLRSADWVEFVGAADHFGIADAKGRLLYASIDDAAFGRDVLQVAPIADAYQMTPAVALGVLRGDDRTLVDAGLVGRGGPGLYVVFARTRAIVGQPRAVFVQLVRGSRLLGEISLGQDIALSLVAPDGTAEGAVPPGLIPHGHAGGFDAIDEVDLDGDSWLVERYQLVSPGTKAAIADMVLARKTEAGLAGLFPHARAVLGGLGIALLLVVLGGWTVARARDLARRRRGQITAPGGHDVDRST